MARIRKRLGVGPTGWQRIAKETGASEVAGGGGQDNEGLA